MNKSANRSPGKCVNRRTNKVVNMNNRGKNSGKAKGGSGMHVINIILLLIVVVFAVFLVVRTIQFFTETCYSKKNWASFVFSWSNDPCISKYDPASYQERKLEDEKEVFHISDQLYTYPQSKCKCESYGSRLATKANLIDAYNNSNANWLTYGWTQGGNAYYPIQKCFYEKLQKQPKRIRDSYGSLSVGLNGGKFDTNLRFGVNCYGIRPKGSVSTLKTPKCEETAFCNIPSNYKASHKLDTDTIAPMNENRWSAYNK